MYLIIFTCGIIIGILVRDIKIKTLEISEKIQDKFTITPIVTQFYEPITEKEKFEQAKNIDDLLDK